MSGGRNLGRLGALILAKRQADGLGLRAAAEQSGVSPSTLSRLERGVGAWPDAEIMAKLSTWLNVSVGDLLFGEDVTMFEGAEKMTTPDIIAVHLRADKNLTREEADALAELLRLAYERLAKS
jgi:transcriptional regulator with XRE-family HTH domain